MHEVDETPCCTNCRAPLWDTEIGAGRWACFRCEDQATAQLRAIRTWFKELDTTTSLMKGATTPGHASGGKTPPAPLRIAILNQTGPGGVVSQLQSGVEDSWRQALGWDLKPDRPHGDIDGVTTFLINNLPWACERYAEVASDLKAISQIHGRLKGLTTGEPGPKKFTAYCDAEDCSGQLRITLYTPRATCPACETEYDKTQLASLVTEYDERSAA